MQSGSDGTRGPGIWVALLFLGLGFAMAFGLLTVVESEGGLPGLPQPQEPP